MSIEEDQAAMTAAVTQAISGIVAQQTTGDDYASARATFNFVVAPDPKTGAIRNDQGWLLYRNGVIATDSAVLYPSAGDVDLASIPGSRAWAEKIQDTWSDEEANKWRKTLWEQGYQGADLLQSDKGGMAYDLINALSAYHQNRYMNALRVLPLAPPGAGAGETRIKDVIDPVALREEIKGWGQVPFEEDLDPDTADYFANQVLETARRLMRTKDWDATRAVEGAGVRVQKKFLKDPNVEEAIEEREDDEMDETLRESIVSIAQLGSI